MPHPGHVPRHRARLPVDHARHAHVRGRRRGSRRQRRPDARGWTWTVIEGTAPDTVISGGPDDPTTDTSASFGFFSTEQNSTFLCQLDGAGFEVCSSPAQYTDLAEGVHEFQVVATDEEGASDPTPAVFTWTIGPPDTTAPVTLLVHMPDARTQSTSADFTFTSEAGATFECALDGGPFVQCTSPWRYIGLADGPHTFSVRATDASDNTEAPAVTWTWTIDREPPDTTLAEAPAELTNSGTARFVFSSEAGATFQCSIDAGTLVPCASPLDLFNLLDGPHSLVVRAVDAAGNADPSPASHNWTIERVAPETTITSGPDSLTRSTSASLEFTSEPGVEYECKLDDAAYADCTSPASYSGLAAGDHTFSVRSTDAAGNVDPSPATQGVDDRPRARRDDRRRPRQPDGPVAGDPDLLVQRGRRLLRVLARRGRVQLLHLARRTTRASRPGRRTTSASARWTASAPESPRSTRGRSCRRRRRRSILTGRSRQTESTSATFTFQANQADATFECVLDGLAAETCSSPKTYSGLAPGPHELEITAISAGGAREPVAATYEWEIGDLTPPVVTIQTGPTAASGGSTEARTAEFTFTVDDPDPQVTLLCSLDGSVPAACTSPTAYTELDLMAETGQVAGEHTFEITVLKPNLLVEATPVTWTWTVIDDTPPAGRDDRLRPDGADLAGHARNVRLLEQRAGRVVRVLGRRCGLRRVRCPAGQRRRARCRGRASTPCSCGPSTRAATSARPPRRTAGSSSAQPITTITADVPAAPATTTSTSATFTLTVGPEHTGVTFSCFLDGIVVPDCVSPRTLNGLTEGEHVLEVEATNSFGFVEAAPATFTWIVAIPPVATIESGPPASTLQTTASIVFSGTDNDDPAGGADVRVLARQWRDVDAVQSPHEITGLVPGELHRARPRDRRVRQRRRAGQPQLDGGGAASAEHARGQRRHGRARTARRPDRDGDLRRCRHRW